MERGSDHCVQDSSTSLYPSLPISLSQLLAIAHSHRQRPEQEERMYTIGIIVPLLT